MAPVRRIVLDVLKPYQPTSLEFASELSDLSGVDGVNALLVETDQKVQNVKLTIEGEDVDYDEIADVVERLGGSIHSIDQVVCGDRVVEESATLQD
jgi:hypothetical protein